MSSRRTRGAPADLPAVRKSRAGFTGAVTKALDRLHHMKSDQPEEIRTLNTKEVDRLLASLTRTEAGFLQTLEDAQAFIPDGDEEEEAFITDEDLAMEAFQEAIASARDTADQLLALKSVLTGLADFHNDSTSISDFLEANPEGNQSSSVKKLETLYLSLKEEWKGANLPQTHSIKAELDSCRKTITALEASVAAVRDKSDSHSITSFTSSTSSSGVTCCGSSHFDLPTIEVPKFHGSILEWSTFWAAFKSSIDSRKELTNTQKLQYLRQAVKDPDVQALLHSPTEGEDMYLQVVDELKERFNKTREIHRHLVKSLTQLSSPKQTRVDLRRMVDSVKRTIESLKNTEHYNIDAVLSSLVYLILPQRLQTLWDQHTKKDKGVPPILQLLKFLREHAETLPSTSPPSTPISEKPGGTVANKPTRKPDKRSDSQKPRGAVHAVTPTNTYLQRECSLCKPERHSWHACPKWTAFTHSQKMAHINSKSLCSNCLGVGHTTNNCKSTFRCRECEQKHHTTIHQQAVASPVNSAVATDHQVPDALMTTAQLLLIGPRGQEIKARALIDSGAGLSLISHRVAQTLGLPLTPSKLHLSGVQATACRPASFLTNLIISPLNRREKRIQCTPAVVQVVTSNLPPEEMEPVTDLPHLMGLHLADETYHSPGRIDILLGADLAPQIMTKLMLRTGKDSEPMAQATEFGWVLSGPATRTHPSSTTYSANHTHLSSGESIPLDSQICQFWSSEEAPGDEELSLSQMEEQAESHYQSNTVYVSSQSRYQVTLPRKTDMKPLVDSKAQATCRYLSNERSILKRRVWEPF